MTLRIFIGRALGGPKNGATITAFEPTVYIDRRELDFPPVVYQPEITVPRPHMLLGRYTHCGPSRYPIWDYEEIA